MSFAAYALAGLHYTARLQASGDEPHYLLMAQSLWQEHDLDLRDNYAREDYLDYAPAPLAPHYAAPRADGRPYPAHSPGLPLLLAPFYAAGGRRACVLFLALLAALCGVEVRRLALGITGDGRAALLAWAAVAGPPLFFYSFHVYTEGPSALALALGLRLLLSSPGVAGAIGAAIAASALPWLHLKMSLAAVALGAVALARLRGRPLVAFGGAVLVLALAFGTYYTWVFGRPTPLSIYGGVPREMGADSILRAAAGFFLDRSFGLLPYAPVYVLALAGLVPLVRRPRREWLPHAAAAAGVLAPALVWRMWWGGQCPPARFVVPLLPFLGVTLACLVAEARGFLVRLRWALVALGWALAVFAVYRPEDRLLLNRADRPTRLWEELAPAAGRGLPSLVSQEAGQVWAAAAWATGLGLVLLLDARRRSAPRTRADAG